MPIVTASKPKLVIVLDPASVLALRCPEGGPGRVHLSIQTPSRMMHAEIASKTVRKVQTAIRQHGRDGLACLIHGRLGAGDTITEVGLIAQPKLRKPEPEAA